MASGIRALGCLLAVGCGAHGAAQRIDLPDCGGVFAASPDGGAIAYRSGSALFVAAGGRRVQLGSALDCSIDGVSWIGVDDGGAHVALYGTRTEHPNVWHGGDREVSAACVIDVASEAAAPLPQELGSDNDPVGLVPIEGHVLMWHVDRSPVLVIADGGVGRDVPLPEGRCAIASIAKGRIEAVCESMRAVTVRTIDLATAAAVGADVTLAHRDVGNGGGVALSRDGLTFAYWGEVPVAGGARNRIAVVDVAHGRDALVYDRASANELADVVPDPRGSGEVLVAINATTDVDHPQIELQVVDASGKVVLDRRAGDIGGRLYWTEPSGAWAVSPCHADRVSL